MQAKIVQVLVNLHFPLAFSPCKGQKSPFAGGGGGEDQQIYVTLVQSVIPGDAEAVIHAGRLCCRLACCVKAPWKKCSLSDTVFLEQLQGLGCLPWRQGALLGHGFALAAPAPSV